MVRAAPTGAAWYQAARYREQAFDLAVIGAGFAGIAIADFLGGRGTEPARWFPQTGPRFRLKRALRRGYDRFQADWIFNLMLESWPMRRAAEFTYFHRRRL